ncbi:hypothetical protein PT974_01860 [Cladobotryum mycophilum]|uniref:Uncharacterized protein n=1 Tax=Cladobotryum mycophilum TaxID=491253 RepID=A0ABR0SXL1_9HYPO
MDTIEHLGKNSVAASNTSADEIGHHALNLSTTAGDPARKSKVLTEKGNSGTRGENQKSENDESDDEKYVEHKDGCSHCEGMTNIAKDLERLSLALKSFSTKQDAIQQQWQRERAELMEVVKTAKCLNDDVIREQIQRLSPEISNREFLVAICKRIDAIARMARHTIRMHSGNQFPMDGEAELGLWRACVGGVE